MSPKAACPLKAHHERAHAGPDGCTNSALVGAAAAVCDVRCALVNACSRGMALGRKWGSLVPCLVQARRRARTRNQPGHARDTRRVRKPGAVPFGPFGRSARGCGACRKPNTLLRRWALGAGRLQPGRRVKTLLLARRVYGGSWLIAQSLSGPPEPSPGLAKGKQGTKLPKYPRAKSLNLWARLDQLGTPGTTEPNVMPPHAHTHTGGHCPASRPPSPQIHITLPSSLLHNTDHTHPRRWTCAPPDRPEPVSTKTNQPVCTSDLSVCTLFPTLESARAPARPTDPTPPHRRTGAPPFSAQIL